MTLYRLICWWIRHLRGRDIVTSIANGNWSEDTTWDFNSPKDGDTVIIHHIVTFDVDQSKFKLGTHLKNFGQFIVSRCPGNYVLKARKGIESQGRVECIIDDHSSMCFDFMGWEDGFKFNENPKGAYWDE